ncbi:uncharacterized protein LOC135714338 isoform X1 [Ochlerotatus camptorhynchus]|uniref:uncharacterized protein LOC135714338 isoform X1 n=1 Tax=Ochlerotatus camptorhynchus TaxID=644619 RepID=UPI0031D1149B
MDEFVENTLKKWNLSDLVERFRDEEVNEEAFLLLTPDIIKELIPKLGRRAIFTARFTELKKSLQSTEEQSSSIASPSPAPLDPKLQQPPTSAATFSITEISTPNTENNDKQFEKYFLEQLTSTSSTTTPVCVSVPNAALQDTSPSDADDDPIAKRIKLEAIEADEYGDSILLEDSSQDSLSLLVESDRSMNQMMNDPAVPGSEKLRLLLSQSPMTRNLIGLNELDKCQRIDLTNVVVHYIVSRERGITPTRRAKRDTFNYWADAIVVLFPHERKTTYFCGMDGLTGKLQQRYSNMMRNKRNESMTHQRDHGEGSSQQNSNEPNEECTQPDDSSLITHEEQRVVDELRRIVSSCFVMRDTLHAKTLTPNQRNILTANIINYLMDKNGGPIPILELEWYAKAIEKIFPNENASIYFRRQGNYARVNGKLFDRYGYMKRKRSLAQGKSYNDFLDSSTPIGQMWEMKTVEEARALWNETHKARKEVTRKAVPAKLYEKFPFLSQPDGYSLFLDDFNQDHPDAIDTFKQNWPEFASNIYRYIEENNFLLSVTEFSTHDSPKRMDNYTIVEIVEGDGTFLYTLPSTWVIKNGWNHDVTNDTTNSDGADLCYWPNSAAGYRLFERAKADPIVQIVRDALSACQCKIKNSNFTTYEEAYLEQQMMEINSALENRDMHRVLLSGPESLAASSKPAENGPKSSVGSDTQKNDLLEPINLVPRTASVNVQASLPSPFESKVEILQATVNRITAEFEAFKLHIRSEFARVYRMNTPADVGRLSDPGLMVPPTVIPQALQNPMLPVAPIVPAQRPIPNGQPLEGLLSPVKNLEDLEMLQDRARDERFVEAIVQSLGNIHGKDRCVGKGWTVSLQTVDFFFDRRFLLRCSWTGSGRNKEKDGVKISKIAFHKYDKVINLFYRMVLHSDPLFTYNDCMKFLHRCVRNAKARAADVKQMRQSVARNRKKRTDPILAGYSQIIPINPNQMEPPEEYYYQVEPVVKEEFTEDNSNQYDVL